MTPKYPPGIDVVVVTYNSASYLPSLAKNLRNNNAVSSVTIVDNGSNDESARLAEELDWGVELSLLRSPSNPGFGASMNLGAFTGSHSPHDQILILNPDVVISEEVLISLSQHLKEHPALATVGPVLETPDGLAVSSARQFPSLRSIALRLIENVDHQNILTEVDWICGASMLWRRTAFEELGGFSKEYFLYFEDVDICRRAASEGWRVAIAGSLKAIHDQGHGRRTAPHLKRESRISRRTYARKWHGLPGHIASGVADVTDWAAEGYRGKRGYRS